MDNILTREPRLLIIGAGDGTVSQAAGRLAYSDTALAVLPLGTTNNAARSLGMPLDLESAVDVIAQGRQVSIDLGRVGDDIYFANEATIGVNAEVASRVPDWLKRVLGRGAYALVGAAVLLGHAPIRALVDNGEEIVTIETHQLIIANGSSHSGNLFQHPAHVGDSRLRLFRLGGPNWAHLVWRLLALRLFGHRRQEDPVVEVRDAEISTGRSLPVEVDGEVKARTPIKVSVAVDALRVVVPEAFPHHLEAGET
jgi:YegS/Rv2252/BmrU family lipid kinase